MPARRGRERECGGVIPRRVRGDTARRVGLRQRLHRVRRAAVLERADVRCRCSALTNTCAPIHSSSDAERSTGVRCTNGAMRVAASSTRARSTLTQGQ